MGGRIGQVAPFSGSRVSPEILPLRARMLLFYWVYSLLLGLVSRGVERSAILPTKPRKQVDCWH
jgi:hypothetical protein